MNRIRSTRQGPAALAMLALSAAPALASTAPQGIIDLPVKTIVADPHHYLGDPLRTEGYVLFRSGDSAQIGGTDRGMSESDSLIVAGPAVRQLNYFDRFQLQGILRAHPGPLSNGRHVELLLTKPPVALGN